MLKLKHKKGHPLAIFCRIYTDFCLDPPVIFLDCSHYLAF